MRRSATGSATTLEAPLDPRAQASLLARQRQPMLPASRMRLAEPDPEGGDEFAEFNERRRRPRARISKTVKLYDPISGRYFAGHTCDISESGLRLEMPSRLPARAGDTACVYLANTGNARGFIEHTELVDVRYVWVRRDPRTGTATCGVEILADTASVREAA